MYIHILLLCAHMYYIDESILRRGLCYNLVRYLYLNDNLLLKERTVFQESAQPSGDDKRRGI